MANNKHLTRSDRLTIESMLGKGDSFSSIARALDKDPSTISKEVKSHLSIESIGGYRKKYNACVHRYKCSHSRICTLVTPPGTTDFVNPAVCAIPSAKISFLKTAAAFKSPLMSAMAAATDWTAL